jgi:GH15 family glucan-1,4-alpha-glucosidase
MPRDIPVGNGSLLVCFDQHYAIRDLFFPHVGQENHVQGRSCRFGVWVDGAFSWVGPEWGIDLRYEPDTLVTRVALHHKGLGVLLDCRDAVDFHENLYLREVQVENLSPASREIRLFFSQDFGISGNSVGDTAAFDPDSGGVIHYKGARYFLVNAGTSDSTGPVLFAVGQKGVNGREGTWRDAEDGVLSGNPVAQGSVDSVIAVSLRLDGLARGTAHYWLAAGQNRQQVLKLNGLVRHKGAAGLIGRTADYWHLWVSKETPPLDMLPEAAARLYRRSLLVLHTQIDWQGGILAGNDSDVIEFNRDTYSYVWPRDGALAAHAFDLAGYPGVAQNFYRFIAGVIEQEGYLLHKYNPDGTPASSWHPWFQDGERQLPIQEDETALVLWSLWHHFVLYRDIDFIKPLYKPLIKNAADFICGYRDPKTGLPLASYDLWEERRGTLSFTVGAVFGGLTAAALFCTAFGETERAGRYRAVAAEVRDAASTHLWRSDLGRFCRMVSLDGKDTPRVDATCDASMWGLYAFGLYTAVDPRIEATFAAMRQRLWLQTPVGGMARYEGDGYYGTTPGLPGNPWFIATLWLADYLVARATREEELAEATGLLEWVAAHALPSGVLAEQVHPLTGAPLSVSPLAWSHATFVTTVQRLVRRLGRLRECPACGLPLSANYRREDWLEKMFGEACDTIHGSCRV